MRVFVNAVALKVAGTKAVLKNFMEALADNAYDNEYYFFIPESAEFEKFRDVAHFKVHMISAKINKAYYRYYIDHILLPSYIRQTHPDVIFSMGNIALPIKNVPQVLLFHIPHIIYPESPYWQRKGARKFFFAILKRQIIGKFRYASLIAAQTYAAKKRLDRLFGLEQKTVVVPNAVSLVPQNGADIPCPIAALDVIRSRPAGTYAFLCLSRYYSHKNLEVLVDVARIIKARKLPYKIMITIEANQGPGAADIIRHIQELNLEDTLVNLGLVSMQHVPELYRLADALLLPTLLESFTGTYAEAAFFHKPIFTSDYDFATDILGDDAVYFDAEKAEDIVGKMDLIKDTARMKIIADRAAVRIASYPDWHTVAKMYVDLLARAAEKQESVPA